MTTISAVTTTKYRVVVEDGGTVRIIGDVTSALSAALSAAAAAASAELAADNAPVQSVFGRTGNVTLQGSDVTGALGYTPENPASKGQANGYASLDSSGLVPAGQLPSYVDDVVEYANVAAFPATGTTGKIYVALDTGRTWRWSGSAYAEIVASPGTTDAITEGVSNLYFTNARAVSAIQANDINLGAHTLAAGAGTFASLVATGLITAASASGFAAGNFFAYDSGGIASVGAAAGSNLRLYSAGVNAVDFNASGTPTFNAGVNVTGALSAQVDANGSVSSLLNLQNSGVGAGTGVKISFKSSGSEVGNITYDYDAVAGWQLGNNATGRIREIVNGSTIGTWSSTGLAVAGTVSATGSTATISVDPRDGSGAVFSLYNPTGDDLRVYGASADIALFSSTGLAVTGGVTATKNADAEQALTVFNNSAGTSAYVIGQLTNGTTALQMFHTGTAFTAAGLYPQDGTVINATGSGGLRINANYAGQTIGLYTQGTERVSISSTGLAVMGGLSATAASAALTLVSTTTTGTTIGDKGCRVLLQSNSGTVGNGGEIVWAAEDTSTERWGAISGHIEANSGGGSTGKILVALKGATTDTALTPVLSIASSSLAVTGTIATTDPAGGAGPAWKLGVAASVSPTAPDRTLRVEIAGTSYYIAAKTTND